MSHIEGQMDVFEVLEDVKRNGLVPKMHALLRDVAKTAPPL